MTSDASVHRANHVSQAPVVAFAVAASGVALFSGMDAIMKGLVLSLGVYNALLWRTLAGTVLSGVLYAATRPKRPSRAAMRFHALRSVLSAVLALLFFWGLGRVPMAQAIALAFVAPILSLFLAAAILKEKLRRTTVIASGVAFSGVLIILYGQTQSALGPEAFWGAMAILLSALCYAWNIILMRQQALVAGPLEVVFYQSVMMSVLYLLFAPSFASVPELSYSTEILAAAGLATASMCLLSWAYARAEANYLASSEYTSFLWATLFGWWVFGEPVSLYTLAGAALIVTGCTLSARQPAAPKPAQREAA
jgi:S-adenosylmethionine uptake transporter